MSKTKNFRRRGDGDGGEDEGQDSETVASLASDSRKTAGQKLKQKKQAAASKAGGAGTKQLLSFAEEDEDSPAAMSLSSKKKSEVKGKPPKSSALLSFEDEGDANGQKSSKKKIGYGTGHGSGHKVGITKEKAQALSNVLPQAGEYTPERLQELQKNTIRLGGVKPPVETKNAEPVVILKGVIKPPDPDKNDKVLETTIAAEVPPDGVADMEFVMDDLKDNAGLENSDALIPDAAVIAAAKAQRERRRKAHTAPDYIPLGTGDGDFRSRIRESNDEIPKKEEPVSSDDEAEVRGRLTFIGDKGNGSKKVGVFEFVDNVEEEDEEKIWEEEQLKKGVGKRVEDSAGRPALPGASSIAARPLMIETLSVEQQAESVMMALQQGLKKLQESHAKTKSDLNSVEQHLSASAASVTSLKESISAAEKKYIYMQKLRDYVSALCDFLQEKSSLIEQLEEHMQKVHENRAFAVIQRRMLDISDEKVEVEAAVGAAKAVLSRGGSVQAASAQATFAASAAAASANDLPPQLDEFGRDINQQKRMERKQRADARSRRAAEALANSASVPLDERMEAECASDESDSEEIAFQSDRDNVLETAGKIFSDASEEFSQLEMVKKRLEAWNQQYPASYRDAYVSLSAPAIFAPFVRLELLKWDPLRDNTAFQDMKWHFLLCDYDDPDLLPSLVEKIALPLLHHELEHCWDRLSTRGTTNAVAAVMEILAYVPAKASTSLIAVIISRLSGAVSETEVPTWSADVTAAVDQAAQIAASRFGSSIKLLRNIGLWKKVLSKSVLDQLGLDELLNGRILPHLRLLTPQDAVARTQRVVAALQGAWIGNEVTEISPKLGAFVQHVVGLGRSLERKRDASGYRELARSVRKMLMELNEHERAREISRSFQLNEAV